MEQGEVNVSSIEKLNIARQLLSEAKSLDDVLHIRDIAEAARVYAQAAKLGLENQNEAAEVKIRAERKAGEMLAQMPKFHGARPSDTGSHDVTPLELSDLGIEKMQSSRWQAIANLPEEIFEEHITETKADGKELTTAGLIRVAKFENAKLDKTIPQPIEGKYRIIYADPPWKYNDKLIDGYGPAEFHYPTMTIQELCGLPIKNITEDNAVLFLWVTSPLLEECFAIIHAWGFEYKTSFVWDKVKHNMGHYNSVRHEFLLVCTRGSCTPDNLKLYDSVQSIERTDHSVKPEEFRNIIDDIYPNGKRIELFSRREITGWDRWGNEST